MDFTPRNINVPTQVYPLVSCELNKRDQSKVLGIAGHLAVGWIKMSIVPPHF
jgi:hypothetical protein